MAFPRRAIRPLLAKAQQHGTTTIPGGGSERLLDPKEPIVFRDPLAPARGARLDELGADRDGEIGDRRVFGLPGAVGHDDSIARLSRRPDRLEGLRHGADLIPDLLT